MKPSEASKLVATMALHYPQAQFTVESVRAYAASLADLEAPAVELAIARLVRTSKFLPSVAEIRSAALDVSRGPARSGGEAWGDVGAAIRRWGYYQTPRFADPGVAEAVRCMGWEHLCRGENEASLRARFIEVYEALQDRGRADAQAGHALPPAQGYAHRDTPRLGAADKPALLSTTLGKRT